MKSDNKSTQSVNFRDKVATVDQKGHRIWLIPQKPKGRLYNARTILSFFYVALFFTLPWLKVDDHPIFLVNILERRFILFGQIFWPQDFFIFALGMIVFIVFIALFTVVFGRVFCGWVCPQTVFGELVFRKIEFFFEGDAAQQRILQSSPWNGNKIMRKGGKWATEWLLSFVIANGFLSYIIGIDDLMKIVTESPAKHLGGLSTLSVFTTAFFFVHVWMREQVCTLICPFGRMQGALLDKDSIIVAYDYKRGDPRGKFHKNEERSIGDCIDCGACVRVCPTGIDIRNGTQLECVNCTACIDACNHMMDSVGLPKGLIRYDSENAIAIKQPHLFTWRMKAYTTVMTLLLGVLVWLLASRTDVGITVLRTPGQLYQEQPNHQISNLYNYKVLNKTFHNKKVTLKPENFKGVIKIVGEDDILIPKDGATAGTMFIYLDSTDVTKRKTQLKIGMYEGDKKIKVITTNFLGPFTAS
jgi:cytochrome c oxidase accessory protein FixG